MISVKKYGLRVYDLTRDAKVPSGAVFVGRPTVYVNPYSHLAGVSLHKTRTAAEAVEKYREYVAHNLGIGNEARRNLKGRDLSCNCAQDECHAVVVMELANEPAPPPNPMLQEVAVRQVASDVTPKVDSPKAAKKEKKVKHVPTFKEF